MLGYSLQKFIHYMAMATFVIADCRRISYLSNKAGAKTSGFRLLGSGFRGFRLLAIHFFGGFRALQQNTVDFDFWAVDFANLSGFRGFR